MSKEQKILFCRIGWMKRYQGLKDDEIRYGGSWVEENEYGGEIFNFQPYKGYMYGYVSAVSETINIERLGAKQDEESVDNVLVVWVARCPAGGGTFIVGWYKNATVYRDVQDAPTGSDRKYRNKSFGYNVKAKVKDCTLIPEDERIFTVQAGDGGMGQSNVWFADEKEHKKFREEVINYINKGIIPSKIIKRERKGGKPIQIDVEKRQEIETKAYKIVSEYYEKFGYKVKDVKKENLGWDLEAIKDSKILRLEVKGLSGKDISVELTPNEYKKMKDKEYRDSYRICIVTNALSKKTELSIFSYSSESGKWEDKRGRELKIEEVESARLYL